jgi:hypothetical protein
MYTAHTFYHRPPVTVNPRIDKRFESPGTAASRGTQRSPRSDSKSESGAQMQKTLTSTNLESENIQMAIGRSHLRTRYNRTRTVGLHAIKKNIGL